MLKHIEIALKEYGIKELPGKVNSARIMKYFKDIGYPNLNEATSWCACFVNWVLMQAGMSGSNKLNARSFLDVGTPVQTPEMGDIVVFWRNSPSSWEGHVAFYITERADGSVAVLGGNQGDAINISLYPKSQVLGYRRLPKTGSTFAESRANLVKAIKPSFNNKSADIKRKR